MSVYPPVAVSVSLHVYTRPKGIWCSDLSGTKPIQVLCSFWNHISIFFMLTPTVSCFPVRIVCASFLHLLFLLLWPIFSSSGFSSVFSSILSAEKERKEALIEVVFQLVHSQSLNVDKLQGIRGHRGSCQVVHVTLHIYLSFLNEEATFSQGKSLSPCL